VVERSVEDLLLLHHRRLGHPSFPILSRLHPPLFKKANKEKLVCDVCELDKHIRSSYARSGSRSFCFNLIHSDVWGPCSTTILNEFRYYVSFIDCFSRVTLLYFMKSKSEVLACFKDFHIMVQTQHSAVVRVLRYDNGAKYINRAFGEYFIISGDTTLDHVSIHTRSEWGSRTEEQTST
jgi:GAG-pre-integrase domain/Zinc-finger